VAHTDLDFSAVLPQVTSHTAGPDARRLRRYGRILKLDRRILRGLPVTGSAPAADAGTSHAFLKTSLKYGYVLGTPEENAAVGIDLPPFFAAHKAFTA
jgi:hypothetical protein